MDTIHTISTVNSRSTKHILLAVGVALAAAGIIAVGTGIYLL